MHIENLKPGDWITGYRDKRDLDYSPYPGAPQPYQFDGVPAQVVAISAPFVVITRGQQLGTIDTRVIDVVKLNRSYVNAFRPPRRKSKKKRPFSEGDF